MCSKRTIYNLHDFDDFNLKSYSVNSKMRKLYLNSKEVFIRCEDCVIKYEPTIWGSCLPYLSLCVSLLPDDYEKLKYIDSQLMHKLCSASRWHYLVRAPDTLRVRLGEGARATTFWTSDGSRASAPESFRNLPCNVVIKLSYLYNINDMQGIMADIESIQFTVKAPAHSANTIACS